MNQSSVNRVEEYFEEDHQVLNKPLHSNIINIKFPKLPKDYSYWLSRPAQEEEKQDSSYGPYRKVTTILSRISKIRLQTDISKRVPTATNRAMFKLGWAAFSLKLLPSLWMILLNPLPN